jgi:hypothetical protein
MNLSIFNLPDPSGRMSRESYVLKKHKEEYDYIIEYSILNDLKELSFKEKVYLCINNIKNIPTCENPNCSSRVKFKNSSLGYLKYCSNKCISSDPNIKKIKEQRSMEKWGTKSPTQSQTIKEKIIETNKIKYGGNSPMSSKEVQNKSKNTLNKNWGVDNPSKSKQILEKRVESFKGNIKKYRESYKKTSLERYGVEHPWSNKNIHQKTIDFFYKSYKERIIESINDHSKFINFKLGDKTKLIFNCKKCNNNFEILTYQFYWRINNNRNLCTRCFPISDTSSIAEKEILNFIKENYEGIILENDKSVIRPYEVDIYLPELNLGFEFNGVYWHSEKFKNKKYHLNKLNISKENGIDLITIWEDEWNIKRSICESFILNKLGKSKKIFARKCNIRVISYMNSKEFLDDNHLQGDCKSSVRIALYLNNDIVSLMTFSKLRLAVGGRSKESVWELTRFCNKVGYSVVGGASRLLKYFINNYNPVEIQTYSDNMISNGDLYKKLGFKYSHTSKPGYWYSINGIRYHRFNFRKDKLVEKGADKNKFEHEIMEEMGYLRVWSAGNKKWILYN